jgi:hypothetical protein
MNTKKQIETEADYAEFEAHAVGQFDGYHAAIGAQERQELPETYRPGGRLHYAYLEGFRAGTVSAERYAQKLTRTTRHLTAAELDRILHSYKLSATSRRAIESYLAAESQAADEAYGEQLAERGRATRYQTRMDAYYAANPLYGPQAAPAAPVDDDDDLPF